MANISRTAVRQILQRSFNVKVTEKGAEKIAQILEREAGTISNFAVDNARREKRDKVTKNDIKQYRIRRMAHG